MIGIDEHWELHRKIGSLPALEYAYDRVEWALDDAENTASRMRECANTYAECSALWQAVVQAETLVETIKEAKQELESRKDRFKDCHIGEYPMCGAY